MMSLEESGRLLGGHCWIERRLYEIVGQWVPTMADPAVKIVLDRHSQHHAWRAGQWWDRLPVVADVDRDALVTAPTPGWRELADELGRLGDPLERLAGAYRVALPRLAARYRAHAAATDPLTDGAARRTLGHVGPDLGADWAEGEAELQLRVTAPAEAAAVAALTGRLEARLVAGGAGGTGR